MIELPQVSTRTCGACNACCKPFSINEVNKHDTNWCSKCKIGEGCTIYENRPEACRSFTCAWLNGAGGEDLRPDRFGVMIVVENITISGRRVDIVHLWETVLGAFKRPIIQKMIEDNKDAGHVVECNQMTTKGDPYRRHASMRQQHFTVAEFGVIEAHLNK